MDEYGDQWHTCYYLARVMVEYQLGVKGLTFAQLMDPAITDTATWREISSSLAGKAAELSSPR